MVARILINGAFRGQQVTGQQRYASEVSSALRRIAPERISHVEAPASFRDRKALMWMWVQSLLMKPGKGELLLTLTSRGPLFGRRQIVAVHDLFVLDHPEWYSGLFARTHAAALRAQLRTARLLLAVSEPVAEAVRNLVSGRVPVIVAANAPADDFVRPVDDERLAAVLAKHGLERDRFLLTVATLDPRKNLAMLVRAYARLPPAVRADVPLVLVGSRAVGVFGDVDEEALAMSRQLGRVSDADLAALYRGATATVIPSLDEGFGLPAVEALASGCAVIASDIAAHRWVCGGDAVYVESSDEEGWTAAMLRAIERPRDDVALRAARERAVARFSWDESARAVLSAADRLS